MVRARFTSVLALILLVVAPAPTGIVLRGVAADAVTAARSSDAAAALPGCLVVLACLGLVVAWLWLVVSLVACVRDELTSRHHAVPLAAPSTVFRPALVRLLVATAFGSVVTGQAAWAGTERGPAPDGARVTHGLRVPERTTGGLQRLESHRVRAGESLWRIAADRLPVSASPLAVDVAWRALYAANRDRIGDDPDLIHPGVVLRQPGPSPRPMSVTAQEPPR